MLASEFTDNASCLVIPFLQTMPCFFMYGEEMITRMRPYGNKMSFVSAACQIMEPMAFSVLRTVYKHYCGLFMYSHFIHASITFLLSL